MSEVPLYYPLSCIAVDQVVTSFFNRSRPATYHNCLLTSVLRVHIGVLRVHKCFKSAYWYSAAERKGNNFNNFHLKKAKARPGFRT